MSHPTLGAHTFGFAWSEPAITILSVRDRPMRGDIYRLISARKAEPHEKRRYHEV